MRYRDEKQFYPNAVHHIYNRGVNKQEIFLEPRDYSAFLLRLGILLGLPKPENCKLNLSPFAVDDFKILGFCLMPNHFHLQVRQNNSAPTSELIHKPCTSYGMYLNRKYQRLGPVWQDTFKAKDVTNDEYLLTLSAYIHNNPANPETYPYSSYQDYINARNSKLCSPNFILAMFHNDPLEYKKFVESWRNRETIISPFWE